MIWAVSAWFWQEFTENSEAVDAHKGTPVEILHLRSSGYNKNVTWF